MGLPGMRGERGGTGLPGPAVNKLFYNILKCIKYTVR